MQNYITCISRRSYSEYAFIIISSIITNTAMKRKIYLASGFDVQDEISKSPAKMLMIDLMLFFIFLFSTKFRYGHGTGYGDVKAFGVSSVPERRNKELRGAQRPDSFAHSAGLITHNYQSLRLYVRGVEVAAVEKSSVHGKSFRGEVPA